MSDIADLDLTELRRVWASQRVALRPILLRLDLRGLTRPARDADERAWLAERGDSVFVEDEEIARLAREYYERKYNRADSRRTDDPGQGS